MSHNTFPSHSDATYILKWSWLKVYYTARLQGNQQFLYVIFVVLENELCAQKFRFCEHQKSE